VTRPNERWSLDFVHDALSSGRKFRMRTTVDDFTRECIGFEVDFSLTG
jgi:putative transposase